MDKTLVERLEEAAKRIADARAVGALPDPLLCHLAYIVEANLPHILERLQASTALTDLQREGQAWEAEAVARLFHDTYERLAPSFGYETRADTKQFDPTTPNGKLMIAVCGEVAAAIRSEPDYIGGVWMPGADE
jgi:hypothetical protein